MSETSEALRAELERHSNCCLVSVVTDEELELHPHWHIWKGEGSEKATYARLLIATEILRAKEAIRANALEEKLQSYQAFYAVIQQGVPTITSEVETEGGLPVPDGILQGMIRRQKDGVRMVRIPIHFEQE